MEHVTHEDLKPIDNPYYNIKCAGMSESCKNLLLSSMGEREATEKEKEKYKDFLQKHRTLDDFDIGLTIPSKLQPKAIKGGVILVDTEFTIRDFTINY